MNDTVLRSFLARQHEAALALAAHSDLLELTPLDGFPSQRWIARFKCRGLVKDPDGAIGIGTDFGVHLWLDDGYLRYADPAKNLFFVGPRGTWHPNVSDKMPFICIGDIAPGTPLCELLFRIHEVLTYQRVTTVESHALNRAACAYARAHLAEFPIDPRPLKRAASQPTIAVLEEVA